MSSTKIQRWLDLIGFLAAHRYPVETERVWAAVPAYARGVHGDDKAVAAVRRTFERDKDELRDLGIPIESVTFRINNAEQVDGYRLQKKNFHLPYLRLLEASEGTERAGSGETFTLSRDELGAALEGLRSLATVPSFPLRDAAQSAARKLSFDTGDAFLGEEQSFIGVADAEAERTRASLALLHGAVMRRKRVSFSYHAMHRDEHGVRSVQPYGLVFQLGRWYLVGHDEDRDAERMYRVGRMADPSVNRKAPGTPDFDVPDDFDLRAYTDRAAWELGADDDGDVEAVVRFAFPRSVWAERNRLGELVERLDDGAQRRSFTVGRRDPFLRWVLSQLGEAEVESPAELRDGYAELLTSVRSLYVEDAGDAR